ncbi:MAG: class II aldolase/adducin family protein [Actinobacteria bacterium]|nr:class II aldolase/adducin family protein [Actinomycetota bacterium]
MYEDYKNEVIFWAQKAEKLGLVVPTTGNFSLRDRETGYIFVTPHGVLREFLNLQDIVVLDINGNKIEGKNKPSYETPIHLKIYKNREDIFGIAHTHSPYAACFAVLKKSIPLIHIETFFSVGGDIPVVDFALPGSEELAKKSLKKLSNRSAVLLESHGVLTIGSSLSNAVLIAILVEESAKIYHKALQVGEPKILSDKQVRALEKILKESSSE